MNLTSIFAGIGFVLALLGWAFNLGILSARVVRSEKDMETMRTETRENQRLLFEKIDKLPCHNPGWKPSKGEC